MGDDLRQRLEESKRGRETACGPSCRLVGGFLPAMEHAAGCPKAVVSEAEALRSEVERLKAERDAMGAAIQAALELADDLNSYAERGAGFAEHWGERVLQAVEPLRDVGKFKDQTLAHNRLLLEANGERIAEAESLRSELQVAKERVAELEAKVSTAQQSAAVFIAHVRAEERAKTCVRIAEVVRRDVSNAHVAKHLLRALASPTQETEPKP